MSDWLDALERRLSCGQQCVLVTVAATRGSAPRAAGAKMVVTVDGTSGSVGGGRLEYESVAEARRILGAAHQAQSPIQLHHYALGPSLGQCCGGSVDVMFEHVSTVQLRWMPRLRECRQRKQPIVTATVIGEHQCKLLITADGISGGSVDGRLESQLLIAASRRLASPDGTTESSTIVRIQAGDDSVHAVLEVFGGSDFHIVLFGAGHVGKALIGVIADLAADITWVDTRTAMFPRDLPANVSTICTDTPERVIEDAPGNSFFLVMTHSHPLDQQLCRHILQRNDFRYLGLIGSRSKRRKFEKRFRVLGIPDTVYKKMTCPIGIDGVTGKHPVEIAIAVAAQILQLYERSARTVSTQRLAAI